MKKKRCFGDQWSFNQIFLKAKLIIIVLFLFIGNSFAEEISSEDSNLLTIKVKDVTMENFLEMLEKQGYYHFFYSGKVDVDRRVTCEFNNASITEILDKVLTGSNIDYELKGKQVVLSSKIDNKTLQQDASVKVDVSGVVKDNSGYPLPGVSVSIKSTTQGTISNSDGQFFLNNVPTGTYLVFSFIGMKTQEIKLGESHVIDVVMTEESIGLNEVVAVGYGTQKKKDLTGSVGKLDMEGKQLAPTTDLTQALQGYTAGLNATSGAKAGETGGLSIRGTTSFSASDYPLIVVDGIIYNGTTADLNINDIESIDVLKDASAAAVYGSRSANGVIAITTKRGKSEKPQFNFNAYYGLQNLANTDKTKVMNADEYAVRLVDYYYQQDLYSWYKTKPTSADGRPERPDVTDIDVVASYLRTDEEKQNYLAGNEVDWVDEVFRVAPIESYNLSVSGNTERTNYYLSTSYTDQKGILLNDEFKRLTFFSKFENKITDWLTVEFNPSYTHLDYSGVNVDAGYALQASPLGNKYDESGDYPVYIAEESYAYHPLGHTLVLDESPKNSFNIVLKGKVNVPWIEGLKYEINYSKSFEFSRTSRYYPTTVAEGSKVDGLAQKDYSEEKKWLVNNIITYDKIFGGVHRLNFTFLHSRENVIGEGSSIEATGFGNEGLSYNSMELAENQEISTSAYEENTISYMGRVNYALKDRYLITATIRRDGFSGFGDNKKYGNFPSLSLGWVVSDESFLGSQKWIDFFKLRVSYGINGNQGIGRYASQSEMSSTSTVFDGATAIGIYSSSLGNEDLGWEKTASLNTGFDYSFWDNRISGNLDVYKAETTDVLIERSIPTTSGNSSVWSNIGGIENRGIEISLSTENIRTSDFKWISTFAYSRVRNKITKLYDGVTQDTGNSWFVGSSINSIYGYKNEGVWQEEDLFNGTIMDGYYPGQFKIKDLDDDGTITSEDDKSIIGSSDANFRISLNNSLSYKNVSFSFFFNSVQGGGGHYIASNSGSLVAGGTDDAYRLNRTAVRAYWRPDAPVNNAPAMYYNPLINPGIYQNKDYIRLQDVTLAYSFSKEKLGRLNINNLKVYVSGKNLYTWTDWSGWDPETGSPMIRSIIGGVNINF